MTNSSTSGDYQNIVIAYRNNAPVFLKNVARVSMGWRMRAGRLDEYDPGRISTFKGSPARTPLMLSKHRNLMPQLKANLPTGIDVTKSPI